MDRTFELEMVDELLEAMSRPQAELTDEVHEEPVESYHDLERFERERERLFRRMPIVAALSPELPEPGSWKTFDETGVPIILVRGQDGVVRGFHNTCGHRGARLVEEPRGRGERWICPFHAWTYDTQGTLATVTAKSAFPGLCPSERGLHPVQVDERVGLIWVLTTPTGDPLDVDAHLGPFAPELARWDIADWHFIDSRVHRVPANWKITMDTFTEAFHIGVLHKKSAGAFVNPASTRWKAFGDHHRQVFAMKNLEELRTVPRGQRRAWEEYRLLFTYLIYPNIAFLFTPDHAEMFQTFPAGGVDSSICVHSYFSLTPVHTEQDRAGRRQQFDFYFNLVATEDFRVADGVQRNIRSGSFPTQIFGRYEPITQAMHRGYHRDLGEPVTPRAGLRAVAAAGS